MERCEGKTIKTFLYGEDEAGDTRIAITFTDGSVAEITTAIYNNNESVDIVVKLIDASEGKYIDRWLSPVELNKFRTRRYPF